MSEDGFSPIERYGFRTLDDAKGRLQFQHEYTLAGLRTLVLINGGAIIGLLTYAGNGSSKASADQFGIAFGGYVVGLAFGVSAYMSAYLSQAEFMQYSTLEGMRMIGVEPTATGRSSASYGRRGTMAVRAGLLLSLLSLASFGIGSYYALEAVSYHSEAKHSDAKAGANSIQVVKRK